MLVIVEGIDRVGKTTLINKLYKEINSNNIKCSKFELIQDYLSPRFYDNINETDKIIKLLSMYKSCGEPLLLVDRLHISDYSYGITKRKYDKFTAEANFNIINNILKKSKCLIIYVHPIDISVSEKMHGESLKDVYEVQKYAINIIKDKMIPVNCVDFELIQSEFIIDVLAKKIIKMYKKEEIK